MRSFAALRVIVVACTFVLCLAAVGGAADASSTPPRPDQGRERLVGTGRLHSISFNVCDQVGQQFCMSPSSTKAGYIEDVLNAWSAQTGSFQEICETTFNSLRSHLGYGSWDGEFYSTLDAPVGRCGADRDWGVAIFVKASIFAPDSVYAVPLQDYGEDRVLFCGNATHFSGFRLCTTHSGGQAQQVLDVAESSENWTDSGAAYILGGDFNIDVRSSCSQANRMIPMYYGGFGVGGTTCGPGTHDMYEADHYTSNGDRTYDEKTYLPSPWKIDYLFFNRQRFYTDYGGDAIATSLSDHLYLRSAMTIHD